MLTRLALAFLALYALALLSFWLLTYGYADVLAGLLALLMATGGVWLSAKGMARLKLHETDALSEMALESAYRYRNAGIAFGLTGSGLLVLSWETFLGRFISA